MNKTALQQAIDKLKEEQLENSADSSTYRPYQRAINICTSLLSTEKEQMEVGSTARSNEAKDFAEWIFDEYIESYTTNRGN